MRFPEAPLLEGTFHLAAPVGPDCVLASSPTYDASAFVWHVDRLFPYCCPKMCVGTEHRADTIWCMDSWEKEAVLSTSADRDPG